jgi:hypothetical protein
LPTPAHYQSIVAATHDTVVPASSRSPPARFVGWTLTVLFLTAAGVLNAIALTWLNLVGGSWPQPVTIVGLALVFAQMGLVALACGFTRVSFAFRALMFISTAAFSSFLACRYDGRPDLQGSWLTALLVHGGIIVLFAGYSRARGFVMTNGSEPPVSARPWQFSLAKLFAVTTTVAILVALATRWRIEPLALAVMSVVAMTMALHLISIAALMAERFNSANMILSFAVTIILALLLGVQLQDVVSAFWLLLLQFLFAQAALGIVRIAGYRLVRHLRGSGSAA